MIKGLCTAQCKSALILGLTLTCSTIMASPATTSLEKLRWNHRLIIVFDESKPNLYKATLRWTTSNQCELDERDMLLFWLEDNTAKTLVGPDISLDSESIDALTVRQGENSRAYKALLIGKDGGVKSIAKSPAELDAFLTLVDAMPMRKQEMQAQADQCS